eukprot:10715890-Alexandrium_andersonii.AAC.1
MFTLLIGHLLSRSGRGESFGGRTPGRPHAHRAPSSGSPSIARRVGPVANVDQALDVGVGCAI